jgi:hypothetical protein
MLGRITWALLLLSIVVVALLPGCRPEAALASPDQARATLREALEAWRKGETAEAFRGSSSITVVERKWRDGIRLLGYEVIGDGKMSGFDWQCRVRLSLQNAGGKRSQEKAVYSVSTSPALVIVRSES